MQLPPNNAPTAKRMNTRHYPLPSPGSGKKIPLLDVVFSKKNTHFVVFLSLQMGMILLIVKK
jgi:hypothetical protein